MMTLTDKNLLFTLCYVLLEGISVRKAENIMLDKPCKVSATYWNAEFANDGNSPGSIPARTWSGVNPYWQGDLQGYFTIHNISVTTSDRSYAEADVESAYVGVSTDDSIACPDVDIFICGQCPEIVGQSETFTFTCSPPRPVRFVKVWRNLTGLLIIAEVEVEGTPVKRSGSKYIKEFNTNVTTPMTSLTAASTNDCGLKCHLSQPCLSFSYHPTAAPNCLLTTNPEDAGTAVGWTKYTIEKCSSKIACDLTDHFN
ncbi:uncharacterized protein LOC124271038 [Haliotis rubra]|uniref:uncharacterized protein LOC124271038 n=1 Tax=Haliotis rubra TaxID=36100 RepID=UPI001EE5EC85|nr:uncharacterized protein LOC124271038 [Haliotis rubra]